MALHAVRNIEEAFVVTREFLLPFDVRRWLKLALVVFFVGSGLSFPSVQFNASGPADGATESELPFAVPTDVLPTDVVLIVVALVVAGVIAGVLFALVGAIMEFVLIESLRTGEVSIRRYWRARWRQGLRLFGFRIAIGIPALATFVGWLALLFVPLFTGRALTVPFVAFLLAVPILFVVALVYGVVSGFTTVFVVPLMIRDDSGVLAGWRRLWASIRTAWKQYLAYAVIGFLLTIAVGLVASIAVGFVALAVFVPLLIVAGVTHVAVSLSSTIGIVVLVGLALVFGTTMIAVWALAQVPVVTYLRYYALLVLGDIDESFDLVADRPGRTTDTGPSDTGPSDTGPSDTGPSDTGPSDTGPSDTGPSDTEPSDTEPSDTEPSDSD
ncbi:DUF7544 domain-containing protein [Halorubrum sp. DTA98]|uniref:DUF7544 domain-containing protein n=1 Tax=Halorubrum sp. DTA98 TaxID=3402163 RepID=UPI003AAD9924